MTVLMLTCGSRAPIAAASNSGESFATSSTAAHRLAKRDAGRKTQTLCPNLRRAAFYQWSPQSVAGCYGKAGT